MVVQWSSYIYTTFVFFLVLILIGLINEYELLFKNKDFAYKKVIFPNLFRIWICTLYIGYFIYNQFYANVTPEPDDVEKS
jgi:hypothetical protein